jgi:hypothetical protein
MRAGLSFKLSFPILFVSLLVFCGVSFLVFFSLKDFIFNKSHSEIEYLMDTFVISAETDASQDNKQ